MKNTFYETWIDEDNLNSVLTAIGWICDYKFDTDDWTAVEFGVKNVDEDANIWFDYPLLGKFEIKVSITMMPGGSDYTLRVISESDIERELNMITWLAQCYRITDF